MTTAFQSSFVTYAEGCLGQGSVHGMCQDARGFLWFCTQDGLARFDGGHWRVFTTKDGLSYPHLWAIAVDPHEPYTFWLGTAGAGICRWRPDHAPKDGGSRAFLSAEGLAGDDAKALAFDARGRLWVATDGGVSWCQTTPDLSPRTVDPAPSRCVWTGNGEAWVGTCDGTAIVFDCESGAVKAKHPGLGKGELVCITADQNGAMWLGFADSGAVRLEKDGTKTTFGPDALPHGRISASICASDGAVWLCTWGGGVAKTRERQFGRRVVFNVTTQKDGLGSNTLQSIFEDRDGRIWLGTVGAGVTCLTPQTVHRPKRFETLSTKDGLGHDMVACIAQDESDRMWFGCFSGGLTCFDAKAKMKPFTVYGTKHGLGHETVRGIVTDKKGRLWCATPGGGLAWLDENTNQFRQVRVKDGLPSDVTRWITRAADNTFWVATDLGAVNFDPVTMTGWRTLDKELASPAIMHIVEDGPRLWFAHAAHGATVWNRDDGTFTVHDEAKGLASNHLIMLAVDESGRAWFGTNGEGLACWDPARGYRRFSVDDGLPHNVVYSVLAWKGAIWGSTVRGVFRMVGQPGDERVMTFDQSDGLGGDECNGRAIFRDRTQRLWFGNTGGASWVSLHDTTLDAPPPSCYLTTFAARDHKEALTLRAIATETPIHAYELIFEYAAVEHVSPHKVDFRFRLLGLEDDWVRRTSERQVRYTNLAPGAYTFEVAARNWTGQWGAPARAKFRIV